MNWGEKTDNGSFMRVAFELSKYIPRFAVIEEHFGICANRRKMVTRWRVANILNKLGVRLDGLG